MELTTSISTQQSAHCLLFMILPRSGYTMELQCKVQYSNFYPSFVLKTREGLILPPRSDHSSVSDFFALFFRFFRLPLGGRYLVMELRFFFIFFISFSTKTLGVHPGKVIICDCKNDIVVCGCSVQPLYFP